MGVSGLAVEPAVGPRPADGNHYRAGGAEPSHCCGVGLRAAITMVERTAGNRPPFDVDPVLDRDRDCFQWPGAALMEAAVGFRRVTETSLVVERRHGAERGGQLLHALERGLNYLDGADLAGAQLRRQFKRAWGRVGANGGHDALTMSRRSPFGETGLLGMVNA
jgi:hypothetical protein